MKRSRCTCHRADPQSPCPVHLRVCEICRRRGLDLDAVEHSTIEHDAYMRASS